MESVSIMTANLSRILQASIKSHQKQYLLKKRKRSGKDGYAFAIAGAHGVGKTTVYNLLQKKLSNMGNVMFFPERFAAKPPVPLGSKEKVTAFRSEVYYLQEMIARNEMVWNFLSGNRDHIAILDRSYISVLVYGRALSLEKVDLSLLENTIDSVNWFDEYIIYLDARVETIMKRILKRGILNPDRKQWNEDDLNYLIKIKRIYERVFKELKLDTRKNKKLFRINTENKTPEQIADEIIEIIGNKTGISINNVKPVPKNQLTLMDLLPDNSST